MSGGVYKRPWWVKQVDEPTTGIDWSRIERFDATDTLLGSGLTRYATNEENNRLIQVRETVNTSASLTTPPATP